MIARSGTDNTARGKTSESRSATLLRALQAVDLASAAEGLRVALADSERVLARSERALSAAPTRASARVSVDAGPRAKMRASQRESQRASQRASRRESQRPSPRPGPRRSVFIDGQPTLAPIPLARTAGMAAGIEVELVDKVVSQMDVDSRVPRVYHVGRF
jgi:hypothetical protein